MPILSADTLFHYTRRKAWLLNMLKHGITPRFSKELEKRLGDDLTLSSHLYVPMACFCDTPLSLVSKHMDIYGLYGIGLTKNWGIENNLNPVFYMVKDNTVNGTLVSSIHATIISNDMRRMSGNQLGDIKGLDDDLVYIYRYLKPIQCGGVYRRGKKEYKNYSYYDEKEWRYVPDNFIAKNFSPFDSPTRGELQKANIALKSHSLKFKAKDINYIIVKNSKDVDDVLRAIDQSKFFTDDDRQYLTTTLITADRIRKDF